VLNKLKILNNSSHGIMDDKFLFFFSNLVDLSLFANLISQQLKYHTPQCHDQTLLSAFLFICKYDCKSVVLMRDTRLCGDDSIRCNSEK